MFFITNPLEQFELHYLSMILNNFNYILLLFVVVLLLTLNSLLTNPNLAIDSMNDLTNGLIKLSLSTKSSVNYETFIFMIFSLLIITNILGMFPMGTAINSQLIYTIGMSTGIIIGTTLLGLKLHKMNFFSLFLPNGAPVMMLIVLFFIEMLSYLSRAISLGLRLGANLLSGHLLVDIVASLIYTFGSLSWLLMLLGFGLFGLLTMIYLLELAIAVIQAYVFTILLVNYLKDVIMLH